MDRSDRSMARCRAYCLALLRLAGLSVVAEAQQTDFPPELLPVHMTALVPDNSAAVAADA